MIFYDFPDNSLWFQILYTWEIPAPPMQSQMQMPGRADQVAKTIRRTSPQQCQSSAGVRAGKYKGQAQEHELKAQQHENGTLKN